MDVVCTRNADNKSLVYIFGITLVSLTEELAMDCMELLCSF